jgi:hypothetical protein
MRHDVHLGRVMHRGGAKPMMSPSGMARAITPRAIRAAEILTLIDIGGSNQTRAAGSAMNSTAAIRPTPRTSATFGCPAMAAFSAASR